MSMRLRTLGLALAAGIGLAGCTDGYGYSGVSAGYGVAGYGGYGGYGYDGFGYDGYYGSGYGYAGAFGSPYWGWYGDYYYPGTGSFVYDRYQRPFRWNDGQRAYWEGRRRDWRGDRGSVRNNWDGFGRNGYAGGQRGDGRRDLRPGAGRPWNGANARGPRGSRRDGQPGTTTPNVQQEQRTIAPNGGQRRWGSRGAQGAERGTYQNRGGDQRPRAAAPTVQQPRSTGGQQRGSGGRWGGRSRN